MGAIFQSLGRTVLAGFVLFALLVLFVSGVSKAHLGIAIWLHVIAGVMWIGLLWYFNFVQIPSMPKIPDDQKRLLKI
jgi:O-antigen/teichoic acid export membrane protein